MIGLAQYHRLRSVRFQQQRLHSRDLRFIVERHRIHQAVIDNCLVDSVAFDDEAQIPAMKALLLETYGSQAVVLRKTDHVPTRRDYS